MELWVGRGGVLDVLADRSWVRTVDLVLMRSLAVARKKRRRIPLEKEDWTAVNWTAVDSTVGLTALLWTNMKEKNTWLCICPYSSGRFTSFYTRCLRVVKPPQVGGITQKKGKGDRRRLEMMSGLRGREGIDGREESAGVLE
eukprot:TRINITY_DN3997_c0_g1_i1.p1 TRINITY_DN3997_c0_g1~~TRINITY_DN3997_c0_g1_i1.p1  ORF type:complete len:142 (+),score=29.47 TRINITY_DN3997_c0_g1_i1:327-752(+)